MLVVALPEGLRILARRRNEPDGYSQTTVVAEPLAVGLPMASVLFPAIIAQLLSSDNAPTKELLQRALAFTCAWQTKEIERIWRPEEWTPKEEPSLELPLTDYQSSPLTWNEIKWKTAEDQWKQALSGKGIITTHDGPHDRLELRRAMVEVDGYVCCVREKRQTLRTLVSQLRVFRDHQPRRHSAYMLIAKPGSGKTYLVRSLARALEFRFLPFNITEMLYRSDLLESFDTIVTSQAQDREKAVLVFVDEINALLEGQPVYDAFLAPLEEGVYLRGGKTFHIEPCLWVFAGTEDPVKKRPERAGHGAAPDTQRKASDFVSRLTTPPLSLQVEEKTKADSERIQLEERLEKVYVAATLVKASFPDVRWISRKVIECFYHLDPSVEVRDVERFVKAFRDIQLGEVTWKNVEPIPPGFLTDESWKSMQETAPHVEIVMPESRSSAQR
jgi:hypothetical protein